MKSTILSQFGLKVGLNTIYQVIGRFATALTGLITARLIISHLGEIGYGEYQIVLAYATFFWLLTDFGLNAVIVGKMSAEPEKQPRLFMHLLVMRTLLSIFLVSVSALFLFFLPYQPALKFAVLIGLITILSQGIKGAAQGIFQARLRYEFTLLSDLIGTGVFLLLILYAVTHYTTVLPLIIAFTIGQCVMTLVSLLAARRLVSFNFKIEMDEVMHLFMLTLPLGISLFFNVSNFKLDAVLLSALHTPQPNAEAVATYNLAYKFFEFGLIFPTFFMNAVYPILMRSFTQSFMQFKKIFLLAAVTLAGVSLLGVILGGVLAPWLIKLIAADEVAAFGDSVIVLRVLITMLPIFYLSSLCMWTVLVFNKRNTLIGVYASAFVLNLITNVILIPRYSYFGAAITTGISELLILVLLLRHIIPTWREYNKKYGI